MMEMQLSYLCFLEKNYEVEIFTEPKPVTGEAIFMDRVREKNKGNKCDE